MLEVIIKRSHIWGLKTFSLEMKYKILGTINPFYKIIGILFGLLNDLQMKIHTKLLIYGKRIN